MSISAPEQWLFSGGDSPIALSGIVALLSHSLPASAADPLRLWLEIDIQVDGMNCGTLRAYIQPLPVKPGVLASLVEATDCSGDGYSGWRHDLSWGNTPLDVPDDPTVVAYCQALDRLGLAFTPRPGMKSEPYGMRLAQACYPLDLTDANLSRLGIEERVSDLLGQQVDKQTHALVLLTPNDD